MSTRAIQDYYPEHLAHCFGCGRLNEHGHRIRTFWDSDQSVTRFTPSAFHVAVPGFVYGGLLASLIDCHSTATAAAAMYQAERREMDTEPPFRFVTGSLQVRYLKATALGGEILVRGRVSAINARKVVVASTIEIDGVVTVQGDVVAVLMPDDFGK